MEGAAPNEEALMDESHYHPALGDPAGLPAAARDLFTSADFCAPRAPEPGDWLASHHAAGQSFDAFVASRPNRPAGKGGGARRTLYLRPILPPGPDEPSAMPDLDALKRYAEAFFDLPVRTPGPLDLRGEGIAERTNPYTGQRQLLSRDILHLLKPRLDDDAFCLAAVTSVDLYPAPTWNFVFGQASLRERVGVYSFARYGGASPKLTLRRCMKVMAHEIGHMFGMLHCPFFACAMNGSNHLDEADARPAHLCPVCLRKLQWSVGFDPRARYRALAGIYEELGFDEDAAWAAARGEPARRMPAVERRSIKPA